LEDYWREREEGERVAYSAMGSFGWRDETLHIAGRSIATSVSANGEVRLVFLRLPDGGCMSIERIPSKALERIWAVRRWMPWTTMKNTRGRD